MNDIRRKRSLFIAILILLVAALQAVTWNQEHETFSDRVLVRGSSGQDVKELQDRLKYIGYLKDVTDGNFTQNTLATVNTSTVMTYNLHGYSTNDLKLMANAVYGEARGEPYIGQVAIAAVILNRVKSPSFPNTPSGVIFEPRAFTAVSDGQIYLTPNETAKKAVQDALNGWDPTGGCTYYFNPATATSPWIWSRPQVKKIGKHIFCR